MMPKRKTLLYRTVPFLIIGLLAFVLYLVFFVNTDEMIATMKQTNVPIYLISVVATVLEVGLFSSAWHYFLKPLSATLPFKKAFMYVWASSFIDLLIPAESVSGEISRIYFITHDGVEAGKAVASVVTQRVLGTFLIVGTLVSGALYLLIFQVPFPSLIQSLIYFVVAAAAVFLCLISVVWFKENWTQNLIDKIIFFAERITHGRWNLNAWRDQARKDTRTFYESIRSFGANPKKLIVPIGFSILSWFFSILVYYLVFAAIGSIPPWAILIVVYSLVIAIKSIPIGVPWEFGVTEIAMTTLFGAFLGPQWLPISAAATILIRIVTDLFRFVVGFGAIQWIGIKILAESETHVGQKNEI
jgi:uncharacterized protein (TIRG00374 family)